MIMDVEQPGGVILEVSTNALSKAAGCMLHQHDGTKLKPIAYGSRKLSPPEKNYSAIDRETLAMIDAVSHFSNYL